MKKGKIILLIILLAVGYSCKSTSNIVLGTYYLEGECNDMLNEGKAYPDERMVTIKQGIKSQLQINIGEYVDFEAFESNDSLFVPLQWWTNFDGSQSSFQGKGKVENDSLFLHYSVGGSFGVLECECTGKKVTEK